MNHIFISYKSEEGVAANRLRHALFLATKRELWWAQDIQTGGRWNKQIDDALAAAGCVIVLWSKKSVTSAWVMQEAAVGRAKGILVPVRIEDCEIPAPFRDIQTVDLFPWDGNEKDSQFCKLVDGVLEHLRAPEPPPRPSAPSLEWGRLGKRPLGVGLIGADGTGKTTLARELRGKYGQQLRGISEVSRNVIKKGYPLGKNAHPESYIALMHDQLAEMHSMVRNGTPFLSDRTLLDQLCYSRVNATLPRPSVPSMLIDLMQYVWLLEREYYSFYFYFPVEFPIIQDDGVREADRDYQWQVDREFQRVIENNNIPIVTVRGSHEERLSIASSAIERHLSTHDG